MQWSQRGSFNMMTNQLGFKDVSLVSENVAKPVWVAW